MREELTIPIPGVAGVEHTADLGLSITAPDLPELFRRAAAGAMWLVLERSVDRSETRSDPMTRSLELAEPDLPLLLRSWIRRLLYWEETEGFVATEVKLYLAPAPACAGSEGQGMGLRASVTGRVDVGPRVREIKGVTLHQLEVSRVGDAWFGQVIFDV